jgi:hypothetical protein
MIVRQLFYDESFSFTHLLADERTKGAVCSIP